MILAFQQSWLVHKPALIQLMELWFLMLQKDLIKAINLTPIFGQLELYSTNFYKTGFHPTQVFTMVNEIQ